MKKKNNKAKYLLREEIKEKYKKIRNFFETRELFIAYLLLAFIFIGSGAVFFFSNNILTWDHYAHVDSAKFIAENTWPSPFGWNPNYFNGYPQNTFYPPLLSWIVATIGLVLPITLAYKLFLLFFYFISPFLFYKFARLFWKKRDSLKLNLILILFFFIPDFIYYGIHIGIGGTVSSTFYVGLGSAFIGFLAIIYFIEQFERNANYFKLGLIFGIGILAHYVFAIVIVYMLISFLVDKNYKKLLMPIISGAGISAFWWIPFIFYKEYMVSANYIIPLFNITTLIILIGIICLIMGKLDNKIIEKKLFAFAAVIFLFVVVFEKIGIEGQLFRVFFIISFISLPLIYLTIKNINSKFFNKLKIKNYNILNLVPILITILILVSSLQVDFATLSFVQFETNMEKTDNLYIVMGPSDYTQAHHILFYEYFNVTGNRIVKGLFSEQSPNIVFNSGLYLYINPSEFIWGTIAVKGEAISKENFKPLLEHFGIRSIITTEPINSNLEFLKARYLGQQYIKNFEEKILWQPIGEVYEKRDIIEYYFSEPKMIEIINYDPLFKADDKDWLTFSSIYLASNSKVLTEKMVKGYQINPNAKIISESRTNNNIKINVDSNVPVPILFKESYFPRWKAYVSGKETPIYLAAPYFMVIVGNGEIELKYEPSIIDQLSLVLSVLFILIVILKLSYKK